MSKQTKRTAQTMATMSSSALQYKSHLYPYGNKVPSKIRLIKSVRSDPSLFAKTLISFAPAGAIFDVWVNSHGAMAITLAGGVRLGIRLGEFEVIEWIH